MPTSDPPAADPLDQAGTSVTAVYLTFPNETVALEIGELLVDRRLAACVNVLPGATSIYRWEGAPVREREVVAIAKTTRDRLDALVAAVAEAHPYELPCVVAYPAVGGLGAYLDWIGEETRTR